MKKINGRTTEYEIEDIFLKRYSPRAFTGEALTEEQLMTLFEAARWAPSSNNIQPWRFLYALRGTADFDLFFSFLMEGNKVWCKEAGVLVIGLSKKNSDDGKFNSKHSLDTGSAWENFALQATAMGLIAHGMGGFDGQLLRKELIIKEDYEVELMIVIGKLGDMKNLPDYLQEREKPSDRKKLSEIIFKGAEGAKNLL
jgi:nitroreductase